MSQPTQVDPRGLRVVAGITAVVLALVLVVPSEPVRVTLLAVQVAVFAIASFVGLTASPWAVVYATVVRPRLAPPATLEDARPPRFAQLVGLAFTTVALVALVVPFGSTTVALVATAVALVAALLNAVVGLCLGCEMYLALRRLSPAGA